MLGDDTMEPELVVGLVSGKQVARQWKAITSKSNDAEQYAETGAMETYIVVILVTCATAISIK